MSYDIKYRRRAIAYWNDGHSKKETAEVFKVSRFTLQKWKSQLKETGNLEPKKSAWAWLKRKLRNILHNFNSFSDALEAVFIGKLKLSLPTNFMFSTIFTIICLARTKVLREACISRSEFFRSEISPEAIHLNFWEEPLVISCS